MMSKSSVCVRKRKWERKEMRKEGKVGRKEEESGGNVKETGTMGVWWEWEHAVERSP